MIVIKSSLCKFLYIIFRKNKYKNQVLINKKYKIRFLTILIKNIKN